MRPETLGTITALSLLAIAGVALFQFMQSRKDEFDAADVLEELSNADSVFYDQAARYSAVRQFDVA